MHWLYSVVFPHFNELFLVNGFHSWEVCKITIQISFEFGNRGSQTEEYDECFHENPNFHIATAALWAGAFPNEGLFSRI